MCEGASKQTLELRILPLRDRPPPPVLKFLDPPPTKEREEKCKNRRLEIYSMFKCLVNTLYLGIISIGVTAQISPHFFFTKVNTYISRSKHWPFILNQKLLRNLEITNRFHWHVFVFFCFFFYKNFQFLTEVNKFLHVHIAKCNIVIDTYLSFLKN